MKSPGWILRILGHTPLQIAAESEPGAVILSSCFGSFCPKTHIRHLTAVQGFRPEAAVRNQREIAPLRILDDRSGEDPADSCFPTNENARTAQS